MSTLEQVMKSLNLASELVGKITLDKSAVDTVKKKCSRLSAQIAVHHALQNTVTHLFGPNSSTPLPNTQSRLTKFIDNAYGSSDHLNDTNQSRMRQIRNLDCEAFLLIAVSYTPLDIFKMHRTEFDYLMGNVNDYLYSKCPSRRWIFRKEIQLTLAAICSLEPVTQLRKRYHELEFDTETVDDWRPAKRAHLDDSSAEKNYTNVQPPDSDQRTGTIVHSQTQGPLPDEIGAKWESRSTISLTEDARRRGSKDSYPQVEEPPRQALQDRSSTTRVKVLHSPSTPLQQQNQETSSKSFATMHPYILPLTEAGVEVIRASVRKGNDEMNIILPAPYGQQPQPQPFMLLPLQICANIMGKYTSEE